MTGFYVEVKKWKEWLKANAIMFDKAGPNTYLPGDKATPPDAVHIFDAGKSSMKVADNMGCLPVWIDHWRHDPQDPPTLRIWWNRADFDKKMKAGDMPMQICYVPYERLRKHSPHLPPMT